MILPFLHMSNGAEVCEHLTCLLAINTDCLCKKGRMEVGGVYTPTQISP